MLEIKRYKLILVIIHASISHKYIESETQYPGSTFLYGRAFYLFKCKQSYCASLLFAQIPYADRDEIVQTGVKDYIVSQADGIFCCKCLVKLSRYAYFVNSLIARYKKV